ncbi:MAG: F0F1 ATP synthase subunit delta [Patescibacteria group bacterium]
MKITSKQYAKLMYEISQSDRKDKDEMVKKIAKIIKKNRDEKKIGDIEKKFADIQKRDLGISEATVFARENLSSQQLQEIKAVLADKKGTEADKIEISEQLDPEIKGGFIIKMDNEVFDGTLEGKLNRLKRILSVK